MKSQKLGKKKTSTPQPRTQKNKKIVRLPASSHTDLAKKHRPGALLGRWLACGRMLTAPPRGTGTGGASANAATGANKQKNGARQLPARRTNASPAVLVASAVGSGLWKTRPQYQAARSATAEACAPSQCRFCACAPVSQEAASTPLKTTFVKRPAASQEGRTGQSGQRIKSPRCLAVVPDVNRTLSVALGAHVGRAPPASLACRARAGAFGGTVGDRHLGGRHEDGASAAPWARWQRAARGLEML